MLFSVMEIALLLLRQRHFKLMLWFIPTVFRKDKCGVMLNVIIRTFDIRIFWGHTVVPMGRIKGRQPSTRFPDLLLYGISVK